MNSEQQISKALFRPPKNLNQDDQGGGEENQSQNVLCQKVLESAADDQPDSEDRMDSGYRPAPIINVTDKVATVSAKLAASANTRYPVAASASSIKRKHKMETAIKANDEAAQRIRRRESRSTNSR